jgi:hypothetical protein
MQYAKPFQTVRQIGDAHALCVLAGMPVVGSIQKDTRQKEKYEKKRQYDASPTLSFARCKKAAAAAFHAFPFLKII